MGAAGATSSCRRRTASGRSLFLAHAPVRACASASRCASTSARWRRGSASTCSWIWWGTSAPGLRGEVWRSLGGDHGPLYQAAYLLGALRLWALRSEVLREGVCGEKEFHGRVLRANEMPIELLRALLLGRDLERDYKARWKFEGEIKAP